MSGAPARGTVPRRQRRHHHHRQHQNHHQTKHPKQLREETTPRDGAALDSGEPAEKRPKVNPIFLWASQREQRIVEVRCEDYDKRNRIKLTKTAQGWRSIPRTNVYSIALANACGKRSPSLVDSPASSVSSNDEKENGTLRQESAANSHQRLPIRMYPVNGANNGVLTGVEGQTGRKRCYEDTRSDENRRGYAHPLGVRDDSNWNAVQDCSENGGKDDGEENHTGDVEREMDRERSKPEDRLASKHRPDSWINLDRMQKDKLLQPRVVLEQLHLSRLLESSHQNVVCKTREKKDAVASETEQRMGQNSERDEKDAIDDVEEAEKETTVVEAKDSEKRQRVNKAGIQDILNMINVTASPVLATDTPTADLPVDSTKTYQVLDEDAREKQRADKRAKEASRAAERTFDNNAKDRSSYQIETVQNGDDVDVDDKPPKVPDEKILEDYSLDVEEKKICVDDKILLSPKNNPETGLRSCKVVEADGGLMNSRPRCRSNSPATWQNVPSKESPMEIEEEAPDEPSEPLKIDYNDNSRLLDALMKTPGLSVSVMKGAVEISTKNLIAAPPARPPSKASSSSRSPDSQAECVEKLLKNGSVDSPTTAGFLDNRCTISPRNLPGLSIIIPNYRYRSNTNQLIMSSPSTKRRVESPESTVSFNKIEPDEMKLDEFPHEEEDEEVEDEDDCDSQVLEDLRRQKADSLVYDNVAVDYYNGHGSRNNTEDRKTLLESAKSDQLWTGSNRSSEAQAKCKYQDLEHFDEQVLEELRSRGTVVSPQPSGIPCSPASRRPSSAYLERLLPSPPCSVSCSEDAKSELTLKSILASSNFAESKDHERPREGASTRPDNQGVVDVSLCRSVHSSVDRNTVAAVLTAKRANRSFQERVIAHNQETTRNPGRPMSTGDMHSNFYTMDRSAPKRPMSVEWSTGRQRNPMNNYQRVAGKSVRSHFAEHLQDSCATSSSTDKLLDPASQLRELIETVGHLIPDPLLVPRDYLPALAAAPATEIPKLLATRPELRLPEALTRPDLLRDPDLLVISLAHLQHVLDHGEGPVPRSRPPQPARISCNNNRGSGHSGNNGGSTAKGAIAAGRPKLICKPIGTLMPAPIDLSSSRTRVNPYPSLLRVRSGLLKQESEVSSTASSPDESQLWHPLFGSQKRQQQQQSQHQRQHPQQQLLLSQQQRQQQHQQQQQQQQQQSQQQHVSWHRTTLAS